MRILLAANNPTCSRHAWGKGAAAAWPAVAVLLLAGCQNWFAAGSASDGGDSDLIHFRDDVVANSEPPQQLSSFEFLDRDGKKRHPKDYLGKKNLVLVFVRGYNGAICPYCSSYTSSLITNYRAIADKGTEVMVVYPVVAPEQSKGLESFLEQTFQRSGPNVHEPPFPVVLDVGLKAVNSLGIRKDLSKPATYILDKEGQVRFAYVGAYLSDRPSIKAILGQLDAIAAGPS